MDISWRRYCVSLHQQASKQSWLNPFLVSFLAFFQTWCQWQGPNELGKWEKYIVYEREKYCASEKKYSKEIIYLRETVLVWEKYSAWQQSKVQLHFLGSCSPTRCNDDLAVYLPKLWRAFYRINASVKVGSFSINGHLHWHWKKRDILHSYGHLWGSDESLNW